jgi:hypothetical protein
MDIVDRQQHHHDDRDGTEYTHISQITSSLKPPSIASDIYHMYPPVDGPALENSPTPA